MGRKRTACERCASIKTLCSKEQPCSRCKRLSLSCEYLPSKASEAHPCSVTSSSSESSKIRVDHKRSFKGCVSCLYRHKKCDEKRPICGDCQRLSLPCLPRERDASRPSTLLRAKRRILEPTNHSESSSCVTQDPPAEDATEIIVEPSIHNSLEPASSDARRDVTPYAEWIDLIYEEVLLEASRKDHLNDSSALMVFSEARVDDVPSLGTLLPVTALNNITGVTPDILEDWPIGERHLLNHFQQVVSRALVVVDDHENPFLLDIVPMAFTYIPVRHAVMALSACHLSRVYADFQRDVFRHQNLALEGLKSELGTSRIKSTLATTLLLCLLEICECSSRKWILYLKGAKALISSNTKEPVDHCLKFLYQLYDFLSSTIYFSHHEWQSPEDDFRASPTQIHKRSNIPEILPLHGVAQDLYVCLNEINGLAFRRTSRYDTESTKADFLARARDIELSLQSWTPAEAGENNRSFQEINAAAMAVQWAAFMRLHQVVNGNDSTHPKVQTAIENILSALSLIRPGSKAEAHILLPLFMAGIASTSKANRLTVEYRLKIMESTIGFGNIIGAHKLLDSMWQSINGGAKNLDWETLIRSEFAGVVLL